MTDERIEQLRPTVPELPSVRRHRFVKDYRLTEYDAGVLTADKETADLFEETIAKQQESIGLSGEELGKETGNWIMVEVLALLKKGMPSGIRQLHRRSLSRVVLCLRLNWLSFS